MTGKRNKLAFILLSSLLGLLLCTITLAAAATATQTENNETESLPANTLQMQMQTAELHLRQMQAEYGEDSMKAVIAMRDLACIYEAAGLEKKASPLLEKAVTFYTKNKGKKDRETLQCMNELAINYLEQEKLSQALLLQEQTLQLRRELLGEEDPDTIGSSINLGNLYNLLGRYDDARLLLEKTLKLQLSKNEEHEPLTITCMNSLALAYNALERKEESLVLTEKVVALMMETAGIEDRDTIGSIANLANLYRDLNRLPEAKELSEKVWKLSVQVLGEKHPDTLSSMLNLANIYDDLGQTNEALALQEKELALAFEVFGQNHSAIIDSLVNIAGSYYKLQRYQDALTCLEKAVQGIEFLRNQDALSPENCQSFFAKFSEIYKQLSALYVLQQQPENAFRLAELAKARTLLESSAARLADQSGILSTAEIAQIHDCEKKISVLNEELARSFNNPEQTAALETKKDQLLLDLRNYRQNLMLKYPKYAQLSNVQIIGAAGAPKLLSADSLFISYLLAHGLQKNDWQVIAFTLDSTGYLQSFDLGSVPHLNETLTAYSKSLQNMQAWKMQDGSFLNAYGYLRPEEAITYAGADEIGTYLGGKLLQPLQAQWKNKKHLIISADGALALVPLEAMKVSGQMLIDNYDISYVQSFSMLHLLKLRKDEYHDLPARSQILAIGDAEYPGEITKDKTRGLDLNNELADYLAADAVAVSALRGGYQEETVADIYAQLLRHPWQSLPTSAAELKNLTAIFGPQTVIYRQKDASEAKLQELNNAKELEKYHYLVFSTHGYFCPQEPALSAIVLNQVHKTKGTDGYITAVKWPAYNLKTDLMFFSACETGIGRIIQGEGVTGLPFALYVAGNTNTVFTLWQVVDESSTQFTKIFFSKLHSGKEQTAALNETKREMKTQLQYANPLFWAPYVLYGI